MRLPVYQVFCILSILSGNVLAQGTPTSLTSSSISRVRPSGVPSAGSTLGPGPISRSVLPSTSVETSATSPPSTPASSGSSSTTIATSSAFNSSSSLATSTVPTTAATTSTSSAALSDKMLEDASGPLALIMLPLILFLGVL